jgi:hypothetical protein
MAKASGIKVFKSIPISRFDCIYTYVLFFPVEILNELLTKKKRGHSKIEYCDPTYNIYDINKTKRKHEM